MTIWSGTAPTIPASYCRDEGEAFSNGGGGRFCGGGATASAGSAEIFAIVFSELCFLGFVKVAVAFELCLVWKWRCLGS